jgi:hypothetical protein
MREHRALFLALVLMTLAGQPHRATAGPWITGERLLERLTPVAPANVTMSPASALPTRELVAEHQTMMNREFVQGYIEAVHDATEGKAWCFNESYQTPSLDTLWDESRQGLRRLSAAQLERNASELLVELWRQKWPCLPDQRRPK